MGGAVRGDRSYLLDVEWVDVYVGDECTGVERTTVGLGIDLTLIFFGRAHCQQKKVN